MLTRRQNQIHKFITGYVGQHEISPTIQEIANHFHLSVSTIHEHLQAIEKKGYLKKDHGQARAMETQYPNEGLVWIPLLGVIAAGQPLTLFDVAKETIAVQKSKIPPSSEIYALRVIGNSMIDENINDGDTILVKHQETAENGQKVVALIDNHEATLKKFYKEKGYVRLQPANKNMEPLILRNRRDVSVQGIVLDVIHEESPSMIKFPEYKKAEEREKLPLNQIICGDAIDVMKTFPSNSIDLVVTSPPYDELRNYKGFSFDFEGIVKSLFRIIKKGGVVVWVIGDQTIKGNETGTSFRHASYFKQTGFNLFDTMIYLKPPRGAVGNNNTYWQTFEYMFVFSKGQPKTINLIRDRENKDERDGDNSTKRLHDGSLLKQKRGGYSKYGRRTNVWEYLIGKGHSASDKIAYEHPAIFPEKLAQDHIISWSKEGEIVYDPFMGSGTTAKMAILNKRNYIGSELSREYCEIAKKRIRYL